MGGIFGSILPSLIGSAFGLLGQDRSSKDQRRMYDSNAALQREFAQQGIRWKVADARAAGIHPLAALGSNTISFTPQIVGGSPDYLSNMGQDISRAISKMFNQDEKDKRLFELRQMRAVTEKLELENQLIQQQIDNLRGPSMPDPFTKEKPAEVTMSGSQGFQAGKNPVYQYAEYPDGSLGMALSKNFEETGESDYFFGIENFVRRAKMLWNSIDHYLKPGNPAARENRNVLRAMYPKNYSPGKGMEWRWNPFKNSWMRRRLTYGNGQLYDVPPGHRMSKYKRNGSN